MRQDRQASNHHQPVSLEDSRNSDIKTPDDIAIAVREMQKNAEPLDSARIEDLPRVIYI